MAGQLQGRWRTDLGDTPDVARTFPHHRDRLHARVIEELPGIFEVILGPHTDDLDDVFVLSSELLEVGGLAPTRNSTGRPVPEQHGSIACDDVTETGDRARSGIE